MRRFAVTTFGCQMNKHDSERMAEVLVRAGYQPAGAGADAEIIVLNTCCVRDKAEQKLRSEVGRLAVIKRRQPDRVLVVAGCMAEQEGRRLVAQFPALDVVMGPDHLSELPALLQEVELGAPPIVRTGFDSQSPRFLRASSPATRRACAYVTTMKGCDERCTFCVVPFTRGPERYRDSDDVIGEVRELSAGGVAEITLLGQTVNSYVDPSGQLGAAPGEPSARPGESEFAILLRAIAAQVPGLRRLRYEASHPRHLSPSLIAAHRDLPVLARHLHLPVQSGSDAVLRRMGRRHTRAEYVEQVAQLREAVPDLTVSTDIIVGFPGEEEADFEQTLSLIDEVGFVGLFAFAYSPRPNTPALKLGDPVAEDEKSRRLQGVFKHSEALLSRHLGALVGSTQQVLIEGPSKSRPDHPSGRSERNEIVHVIDGAGLELRGHIVDVEIVEALGHSLLGRLTAAGEGERG